MTSAPILGGYPTIFKIKVPPLQEKEEKGKIKDHSYRINVNEKTHKTKLDIRGTNETMTDTSRTQTYFDANSTFVKKSI